MCACLHVCMCPCIHAHMYGVVGQPVRGPTQLQVATLAHLISFKPGFLAQVTAHVFSAQCRPPRERCNTFEGLAVRGSCRHAHRFAGLLEISCFGPVPFQISSTRCLERVFCPARFFPSRGGGGGHGSMVGALKMDTMIDLALGLAISGAAARFSRRVFWNSEACVWLMCLRPLHMCRQVSAGMGDVQSTRPVRGHGRCSRSHCVGVCRLLRRCSLRA